MYGEKRYVVLRVYCWMLKAASVLALFLVVVGFVYSIVQPTPVSTGLYSTPGPTTQIALLVSALGPIANAIGLAIGFVSAVGTWALANYLEAHMSIEENTREMVELMRQRTLAPTGSAYMSARDGMWTDAPPPVRRPPSPPPEPTPVEQYMKRQNRR